MEELDIQKRRMLENTGLWEAKIKQLEMAKANLIAEKGLMAESLASLQDQHRAKVDEMATFQKVTDLNITELRDEIAALERKLDAEQVAHQDLASRHESLQSEHTATLEDKTMLTQSVTDLYHKAAKFQFEVNSLKEQLARVTEEKCATQSSLDQTRAEKAKLEGEMARLHTHILDLEAAAAAIQREHNQLFESRDKTIAGLQVDVRDLKTEIQSQAIARRHLMRRLRELIDLYKSEHEKLRAEIVLRQQLETRLNDLRVSHENELRARIAFEGIQHRMSWKQAERDLLAFRQLKERERKFLWLDRELHEEFERLNGKA